MLQPDRRHEFSAPSGKLITKGISQVWVLPPREQADVIAQAMRRWDAEMPKDENLRLLKMDRPASNLVRPEDQLYSSKMNGLDVITACLLGNIEVYPWEAMTQLEQDSMKGGSWDGVNGQPGCFWVEQERLDMALINPADDTNPTDVWAGPIEIDRAKGFGPNARSNYRVVLKNTDSDDGIIIMKPLQHYLIGMYPAFKLNGVEIEMSTRSRFARWGLNGMVNSDKVHNDHNGLLTAETIVFARKPLVFHTSWNPWQYFFSYSPIAEGWEQADEYSLGHAGDNQKSLKEAVADFTPEKMLPHEVRPERRIKISGNQHI